MADKNFEYLGNQFQLQLLNQLIVDKDFAHSIVEVLEPSYFENKYFKLIVQMVKEYYQKFEHSPSFDTLSQLATIPSEPYDSAFSISPCRVANLGTSTA